MNQPARNLTPYDKGTVLEPKVWVRNTATLDPAGPNWVTGSDNRASVDDDFGRVDFDADDGTTIIVGLRVIPGSAHGYSPTIEFAADGMPDDTVTIRNVERSNVRIRIAHNEQLDTVDAALARAQRAIDQVADTGSDDETALQDTLTDLLHWAERHRLDLRAVLDIAELRYDEERD